GLPRRARRVCRRPGSGWSTAYGRGLLACPAYSAGPRRTGPSDAQVRGEFVDPGGVLDALVRVLHRRRHRLLVRLGLDQLVGHHPVRADQPTVVAHEARVLVLLALDDP